MRKKTRLLLDEEALEPVINLTPLIDVVFVVLITFILIAPMLEIDTVDLASGTTTSSKELTQSALSISVHADNTIWLKNTKLTLPQLEKLLRDEKKRAPKAIPQLIHDKNASFGTYQQLKTLLESIGFEQVDVVLKPS